MRQGIYMMLSVELPHDAQPQRFEMDHKGESEGHRAIGGS